MILAILSDVLFTNFKYAIIRRRSGNLESPDILAASTDPLSA